MPALKQLQHEYDTTRGLWCIDRNPIEVDHDWIKRNAFQLQDYLKDAGDAEEREKLEIKIGGFTLKQGTKPGRIWLKGQGDEGADVDEKVLEDVLKSFF